MFLTVKWMGKMSLEIVQSYVFSGLLTFSIETYLNMMGKLIYLSAPSFENMLFNVKFAWHQIWFVFNDTHFLFHKLIWLGHMILSLFCKDRMVIYNILFVLCTDILWYNYTFDWMVYWYAGKLWQFISYCTNFKGISDRFTCHLNRYIGDKLHISLFFALMRWGKMTILYYLNVYDCD